MHLKLHLHMITPSNPKPRYKPGTPFYPISNSLEFGHIQRTGEEKMLREKFGNDNRQEPLTCRAGNVVENERVSSLNTVNRYIGSDDV